MTVKCHLDPSLFHPHQMPTLLKYVPMTYIVPSQVPLLEAMTIINLDDIELLGSTTTSFLAVTFSLIVSIARPLLQTGTIPPHVLPMGRRTTPSPFFPLRLMIWRVSHPCTPTPVVLSRSLLSPTPACRACLAPARDSTAVSIRWLTRCMRTPRLPASPAPRARRMLTFHCTRTHSSRRIHFPPLRLPFLRPFLRRVPHAASASARPPCFPSQDRPKSPSLLLSDSL